LRLFGRRPTTGYPPGTEHLAAIVEAIPAEIPEEFWWEFKPADSAHARQLLDLPREEQPNAVLALVAASMGFSDDQRLWGWGRALDSVAIQILRRKLPWTEDKLVAAFQLLVARGRDWRLMGFSSPINGLLAAVEKTYPDEVPPERLAETLKDIAGRLGAGYTAAEDRQALRRIERILGWAEGGVVLGGDPWSNALRATSSTYPQELGAGVLAIAALARSARPTQKFEAAAERLVEEHGSALGEFVGDALSAAAAVRDDEAGQIPAEVGDLLRGLAWLGGTAGGERAVSGLGDLAIAGWRKVPQFGPLCAKAANACIGVLATMPEGAAQLGRVRVSLKQPQAVAKVEEAIATAADMLGIPSEQFVERVVPDMGLIAGERVEVLGEHEAVIGLGPDGTPTLRFRSQGKDLKGVPAAVKSTYADELRALRRDVKDLKAMVAAQRSRLDRMLMDERIWSWADWRSYYWDHGLVGPLARRLIWELDATGAGDWTAFVEHDGKPVSPSGRVELMESEPTRVRLWHPAASTVDEVRRWREFLEDLGVQQPFKQAHREIYLLTDAERTTATYSNRFASHILKQHQFSALCRARGWSYSLQGAWDSPDVEAVIDLPQHGLKAAYWVERPWDQFEHDMDVAIAESGVFIVITTDQVRFINRESEEAVPLDAVPDRVFSEVMRDVDLFVAVCSIGNDPTWVDHTEARPFETYWHDFAFGELSAQAETRRDVLQRLLPKLALRDIAHIDGRFLRVEGKLRTYKIHLGSTNILMEPNDQYLCIVPGRGKDADKVYLPFEGDNALALILSKAFLLAADDKIEDSTITSQIKPR
jgi:hypothetical protein